MRGQGKERDESDDTGAPIGGVPVARRADALRCVRQSLTSGGRVGPGVLTDDMVTDLFAYRDGVLHCEGISAERLVAEYGTPLYVYSQSAILERYRAFTAAFASL